MFGRRHFFPLSPHTPLQPFDAILAEEKHDPIFPDLVANYNPAYVTFAEGDRGHSSLFDTSQVPCRRFHSELHPRCTVVTSGQGELTRVVLLYFHVLIDDIFWIQALYHIHRVCRKR